MLSELGDKIKSWSRDANVYGLNMPMLKDPKTGAGSVSLTLVFLSSSIVIVGLVGKWAGYLGPIDIVHALEFFYASSALYFGRKWTSKDKNTLGEGTTVTAQTAAKE